MRRGRAKYQEKNFQRRQKASAFSITQKANWAIRVIGSRIIVIGASSHCRFSIVRLVIWCNADLAMQGCEGSPQRAFALAFPATQAHGYDAPGTSLVTKPLLAVQMKGQAGVPVSTGCAMAIPAMPECGRPICGHAKRVA